MARNSTTAYRAIAQLADLRQRRTAVVSQMKAMIATADQRGRDLDASESQKFSELKARAELYDERERMALEAAGAGPGATAGFETLGAFAQTVAASHPRVRRPAAPIDERLRPLAAAPTTGASEGAGADGGYLVPPGFSADIFTLALAEDSLLPYCDDMPVEGNVMQIPKDETTPWGTNGIRAYWQGEAGAGTPTKPALGLMDLRLKKLLALTPVSDELLADASALTAYLPKKMSASIRWKSNEAILFGAGNGVPIGAMTALPNTQGAVVTVAKDSGQVTNTLSVTNLAAMVSRLPPGSQSRAVWLVNNSVLPALMTLTLGNYPMMVPLDAATAPLAQPFVGTVLGRPVLVSQHANAFSSQGDVLLLDLSYYQVITKAEGIQTATSMHLYFDADAMAFRTTFRMDGQPKLTAPIPPARGTWSLSPFVQLGAR